MVDREKEKLVGKHKRVKGKSEDGVFEVENRRRRKENKRKS